MKKIRIKNETLLLLINGIMWRGRRTRRGTLKRIIQSNFNLNELV